MKNGENDNGVKNELHGVPQDSQNSIVNSNEQNDANSEIKRLLEEEKRKNELLREELKRKEKDRIKQEIIQRKIQEAKDKKIAELRLKKGLNEGINYNAINAEELFNELLEFIRANNINYKKPIDPNILNNKFGENNIVRLINKSYLFKTQKGIILGKIK